MRCVFKTLYLCVSFGKMLNHSSTLSWELSLLFLPHTHTVGLLIVVRLLYKDPLLLLTQVLCVFYIYPRALVLLKLLCSHTSFKPWWPKLRRTSAHGGDGRRIPMLQWVTAVDLWAPSVMQLRVLTSIYQLHIRSIVGWSVTDLILPPSPPPPLLLHLLWEEQKEGRSRKRRRREAFWALRGNDALRFPPADSGSFCVAVGGEGLVRREGGGASASDWRLNR